MELAHAMRGVSRLAGDQLASLLHAATTFRPRHVSAPGGQIAPQLVEHEWVTWPAVEIDGLHLATVEVHGFGSPHALTCEGLHELPFEARWLGDNSVTEGFAMLFDHMTLDPRWLVRYTPLKPGEAKDLVFELDRFFLDRVTADFSKKSGTQPATPPLPGISSAD